MGTENLEFCARNRLELELREYKENPPANISFGPISDENMFQWQGIIFGPLDTPIEGHIFELSLKFPIDYPCKPPKVKFETQGRPPLLTPPWLIPVQEVFHPNVDVDGSVYLNILGDEWSSALSVEKLLFSISSILLDPMLVDCLFQ